MLQVGHSAGLVAPTSLVGGAALGGVAVPRGQKKLDDLTNKLKMRKAEDLSKPYVSEAQRRWAHTEAGKEALGGEAGVKEWDEATRGKKLPERADAKKSEDLEGKPMPTNEKDPKDWETIVGEKLNRFSQLLRSEIVRIKLQKFADKIKE